ncbi:hypothetical protein J4Q44_G00045640 [Coregonus suidteri]|uniref:Uncharacterized protein n=1 Tax=Coregonus suidteri TaxID=861788 RepID=A0AAN8RF67_9TELE
MDLQPRILLVCVSQKIRHDGLIIGNIRAEWNGNRLTKTVFWYRNALLAMILTGTRLQQKANSHQSAPRYPNPLPGSPYRHDSSLCVQNKKSVGRILLRSCKTPKSISVHKKNVEKLSLLRLYKRERSLKLKQS